MNTKKYFSGNWYVLVDSICASPFCFAMLKMSPNVVVWVDDDLPSLLLLLLLSLRGSLDSWLVSAENTKQISETIPTTYGSQKKRSNWKKNVGGCPNQLTKTFYLLKKYEINVVDLLASAFSSSIAWPTSPSSWMRMSNCLAQTYQKQEWKKKLCLVFM